LIEETRRLVIGISEDKISQLIDEDKVKAFAPYSVFQSFQIQNLFYTENNPQTLATRHLDAPYDINLPEGSMRFMKVRMPTKTEMITELKQAGEAIPDDWTKFNLHNTDSVDYIYILSGAITCVVGKQVINLKKGDFIVQVGPEHTWINEHDEPCYILCVMVGIKASDARKKMGVE
jgi:mannose-6-phosphate isomerase-like protein (cupin superfamily)